MQAIVRACPRRVLLNAPRCYATATANPIHVVSHTSTSSGAAIPLSNVEAQWEKLTPEEQVTVHQQLEELQKKDWKELSIDEKKAAYYVAFGPHGPRTPTSPPGQTLKIIVGTLGFVGVSTALWFTFKQFAQPPPRTLTKEWQEAATERAKEQNINPISGISSEGYSGKGFVTHK